MEIVLVIAAILALTLLGYMVYGAIGLFGWALESGFVGVVAYFACWIFLAPFMAAGCVVAGIIAHASS